MVGHNFDSRIQQFRRNDGGNAENKHHPFCRGNSKIETGNGNGNRRQRMDFYIGLRAEGKTDTAKRICEAENTTEMFHDPINPRKNAAISLTIFPTSGASEAAPIKVPIELPIPERRKTRKIRVTRFL